MGRLDWKQNLSSPQLDAWTARDQGLIFLIRHGKSPAYQHSYEKFLVDRFSGDTAVQSFGACATLDEAKELAEKHRFVG
jgi:hypothetical protein